MIIASIQSPFTEEDSLTEAHREKRADRLAHLKTNPDARITVDIDALSAIHPFDLFLCHPNSSVAANCAVHGSDIDCGMIITGTPMPIDAQYDIINKLREHGIKCYHRENYDIEKATTRDPKKLSDMRLKIIEFKTHDDIRALARKTPGDILVQVYKTGHLIGGTGERRNLEIIAGEPQHLSRSQLHALSPN